MFYRIGGVWHPITSLYIYINKGGGGGGGIYVDRPYIPRAKAVDGV